MIEILKNQYKSILTSLAVLVGIFAGSMMYPAVASAAPVDVLKACNASSEVCKGTGKNSLYTLIGNVVNLLIMIIGIISVIMIVIGGFRYTTSGGDSGEIKTARDTIIYAVVGLVVAIMSFSLVNFVLNRL